MDKKMLTMKVDPREKNAMDFVSGATGGTLARLLGGSLRRQTRMNLGYLLLHALHGEEVTASDMTRFADDPREALREKTPMMVLNFHNVMGESETWESYRDLFPGVSIGAPPSMGACLDLTALTEEVGAEYIRRAGDLDSPDPPLVLDSAMDVLLRQTFNGSARGSIQELNDNWVGAHPAIDDFKKDLTDRYVGEFGLSEPVVPSMPAKRSGPGKERPASTGKRETAKKAATMGDRKKDRKGKKKKTGRKKGRKPLEAVEVEEVAPVVEVDEITEE